ncbi:hypothetical protein E2986_12209 [Frieseomelitta varia]|uniref:Cyclin-like domain-containing protein n=1 Tax=Frieseomelitta varia TaxID=561572 RepID=A0A833RV33_9HYME|nr:hypothetical protein E2986_12209 [Frieseomelitta varia]
MRFANKLEFGEKTHEVSMTALRVVQRMKKDSIHSGRRPSGLCGAALLMAARLHEFNRSPADIIKIVKVHESTLRKRLIEFGDTPSSALTLEEFMTVDLEEEQDPPAFKAARKKDKERLQRLNIDTEIKELQAEIDKQLEEHRLGKTRKRKDVASIEKEDTDRFVRESNLDVIKNYVGNDVDDPDNDLQNHGPNSINDQLITGLGPNFASMGLISTNDRENEMKDLANTNFENDSGEIDVADFDDEELDSYIMSEKEAQFKHNLWNKVLKSLNVNLNNSTKEQQKIEEPIQSPKKEINISSSSSKMLIVYFYRSSVSNSLETQNKPNTPVVKKPRVTKPQTPRKDEEVQMPVEIETNTTESILPRVDTSLDMGI